MKKLSIFTISLLLGGVLNADIPLMNYECPGNKNVHADKGGPVYINGKETKLKKFNDSYYEASGSGIILSITRNEDGSTSVSYSGKNGANGICQEKNGVSNGGIPLMNYKCPGNKNVHADKGGPVYINGKETKLKKFNDSYYEASGSGIILSITRNEDGSTSVSYSGKNGANGICQEIIYDIKSIDKAYEKNNN